MKNRIVIAAIAVVMALLMAVMTPLQVFAEAADGFVEGKQKLYISEVRMSESKEWLIGNGYTVIDHELNAKTSEADVYLGYMTTTNPDQAITGISTMDMNGGYYRTDYRKMMEKYSMQLNAMTDEFILAADEFRVKYNAGSPAAKAACKVLNYLYVDDADNQPFGDWIVSENNTRDLMFDILMMCDQTILSLIYNQFAVGCQNYNEETWIEKLSAYGTGKSVVYDDSGKPTRQDVGAYVPEELSDEDYHEGAYALITAVEMYAKMCSAALKRRNANNGETVIPQTIDNEQLNMRFDSEDAVLTLEEVTEDSEGDIAILGVYDYLSSYQYGDGTVADLFMQVKIDEISSLYPIVKILTPGQLAMMKMVGVSVMATTATNTEEAYRELDRIFEELSQGMTCSVWNGANRDVYNGEIGVTEAAQRQMSSSGDFRALTSDKETMRDKTFLIAKCVGIALCATVAAYCITVSAVSIVGLFASYSITSAAFSFCLTATIVSTGLLYVSVFIAAVLVVVLIVALVDYIIEWYEENHPEYTSIPDIMYDVTILEDDEVEYVRYDVVLNEGGTPGDLNAWAGKEWNAVYTTKDPAAGSPIVADENGEVFSVQYDNGTTPRGYEPLHYFGNKYAVDTNDHVFEHNVSIYIFYHTDESYYGIGSDGIIDGTGKTKYIREVYFESRSSGDSTRYSLENKGFTVVNMDLTPFNEDVTYIGYKTTTNSRLALTDIRLAYSHNAEAYIFGEASYGNCGTVMSLTMYATKYTCAGSPIIADIYATKTIGAPEGYEPISLFSGGSAFNFGIIGEAEYDFWNFSYRDDLDYDDWEDYNTFLYYKPSVTYTEGNDYISGFTFFQYNANQSEKHNEIWDALGRMQKITGVKSTGYDMFHDGDSYAFSVMYYTTTKNPYRALRTVKSHSIDDEEGTLPQNLTIGNIGLAAVQPYCLRLSNYKGYRWMERGNTYISQRVTEGEILDGSAEAATGLYVAAATTNGTPFTYDDILFTDDNTAVPEGYYPVTFITEMYTDKAADLACGNGSGIYVYMYIKGEMPVEPTYVGSICLTKKSGDEGNITLLANGCDNISTNRIGSSDKLMVGTKRTNKKAQAMRDIKYVLTDTTDKPSTTMRIQGITYTLASEEYTYIVSDDGKWADNIVLKDGKMPDYYFFDETKGYYAWIYYTRNPKAGSPLLDVTVKENPNDLGEYSFVQDVDGMPVVTVSTLAKDSETGNITAWGYLPNLSVLRENTGTYITSLAAFSGSKKSGIDLSAVALKKAGFINCLDYDFNYYALAPVSGSFTDVIRIGYNRTSEPYTAITGIVAVHNSEALPEIVYNDITYYLASATDLNSTVGGDYIYLYYTKDAAAGKPITDIMGVDVPGGYEVVQRTDGGNSNLNAGTEYDGCDGDNNCYLAIWRDNETALVVKDGLWSVASVFTDNPKIVVVLSMVLVMLFGAAGAVAFTKYKRKKEKTEKN